MMPRSVLPSHVCRRLVGALLALGVFALLVLLGVWQVQRLHWKEDLIAKQAAALAAVPQPLAAVLARPEAERLFWPVTVTGRFVDVRPFVVGMRPRDGQPGYHLVQPFMVSTGSLAGRTVLVNLGWSPLAVAPHWRMPPELVAREWTLDGIARLPEATSWLSPRNQPDRGEWYTVDPRAMLPGYAAADVRGAGEVLPLFIQLRTPLGSEGLPIPLPAQRVFRNDHRNYAVFWFTMAGIWGVMMGIMARRRGRAAA